MPGSRIIFGKPRRRPKGRLVARGASFAGFTIKNECQYSILPDEYQERAAEAFAAGTLDLLDNQLRCTCGAMVGAIRRGEHFGPTRHPVYKEGRRPAQKRGPRK